MQEHAAVASIAQRGSAAQVRHAIDRGEEVATQLELGHETQDWLLAAQLSAAQLIL